MDEVDAVNCAPERKHWEWMLCPVGLITPALSAIESFALAAIEKSLRT